MAAKPAKSKGERLFDRITYVGIAGVGTFVVTVPLAYELEHHPSLAPLFEKTVRGVESLAPKLGMNISNKTARGVVKTTTLMQGGNLMLLPVGIMEHYKVPIVRGANAMMKDPTPEDQVKEVPPQTISSLFKSRVLAWLMVFGSLTAVGKVYQKAMPMFEEETGQLISKIVRREQRLQPGELLENTRTFGYGKIAALDMFATAAAATLLYVGGHFFARKQEERKERREEKKLEAKGFTRERVKDVNIAVPETVANDTTPTFTVGGSKQHEGMAREAELAQQV